MGHPSIILPLLRALLFRARFRRNQAGYAVIDDQLPIVLAAVLDEFVGIIEDPNLLVSEGIDDGIGESLVAFGLDGGGSVGEGLLNEGDDFGLGLELVALRVFLGGRLLANHVIDEVVVGSGGVQQLLGETALGGIGFEVVFIFGKIFGHGDELAADVVPGVE